RTRQQNAVGPIVGQLEAALIAVLDDGLADDEGSFLALTAQHDAMGRESGNAVRGGELAADRDGLSGRQQRVVEDERGDRVLDVGDAVLLIACEGQRSDLRILNSV